MSTPAAAISPRSVADKSQKSAMLKAIRMALEIESPAVRHNTQTFNSGRYEAVSIIPDYNALKDRARAIKEDAIARLPQLLAGGSERKAQWRSFLSGEGRQRSVALYHASLPRAPGSAAGERQEHDLGRGTSQPSPRRSGHRSRRNRPC